MYVGGVSMSGYNGLKQSQSSVQDADLSIGTQKPKERKKQEKEKSPVIRKREKRESDLLTQARLKELMHYDPINGIFTWLLSPNNSVKVGSIAGSRNKDGYIHMWVNGARFRAHRLAFLYMEGYFPEHQVDHIDRNPSNNIWSNLRHVGKSCNMLNRGMDIKNTSGVKGICWKEDRKKWHGQIRYKGKQMHLGLHTDFTEAVAHRLAAEQALDWSGCDSNSSAYQYMQAYVRGEDMQSYLKDLASK